MFLTVDIGFGTGDHLLLTGDEFGREIIVANSAWYDLLIAGVVRLHRGPGLVLRCFA